jgi:UPF0716 protein FxsA
VLIVTGFIGAEVAALLELGGRLGVGWTLAWIVLSALAGGVVLRFEGLNAFARIHHRLRQQQLPTLELLDLGLVLSAALLLILPGFIADALGLLLLLPPVRWFARGVFRAIFGDPLASPYPPGRSAPVGEGVIELRRED